MDDSLSQKPPGRLLRLEPWPLAIVLFFVVVVAVNLLLVRLSQLSWTGLVTEGAYVKGLAFNRTLEAQRAQEALGWRVALDVSLLSVGREGRLLVSLWDRHGQPLSGVGIQGVLFRPVHQGVDQSFVLAEVQPGIYGAGVMVPLPGQWEVRLNMVASGDSYHYVQRIHLPAAVPGGGHESR